MKNIPVKEMTLPQIYEYIRSIYGEDVGTDFDVNCIGKMFAFAEKGKIVKINVIYSKIKVTPNDSKSIYWPIGEFTEEINLEYGLSLLEILK